VKVPKEDYLKAIKRGIKKHIEECEEMIGVEGSEESDCWEGSREHWIKEKKKSEEKLGELERENGSIDEGEAEGKIEDETGLNEEFTETDEERARQEGWDSASQAREWTRSSRQMDKFRKEMSRNAKLRIVEDLYAVGLSPEEVYGVADKYGELIKKAAGEGGEEEEEEEEEDEGEDVFE